MEIIGNESFIELIQKLKDHKPFPHTLLYGPSGVGKSTLGKYISSVTNNPVKQIATTDLQGFYIPLILQSLKPETILLMDEIHTLKPSIAEALYQPMDEYSYFGKSISVFSLIGMTTSVHKLPDAFIRRFKIRHRLDWYSSKQICEVLKLVKQKEWEEDAIIMTSMLARGTPGLVCNFVEIIEGLCLNGIVSHQLVYDFRRMQNMDSLGLRLEDTKYLQLLHDYGRLSIATLSSLMGEAEKSIETQIEPFLFRIGLVVKEPRGRRLTPHGINYVEEQNNG